MPSPWREAQAGGLRGLAPAGLRKAHFVVVRDGDPTVVLAGTGGAILQTVAARSDPSPYDLFCGPCWQVGEQTGSIRHRAASGTDGRHQLLLLPAPMDGSGTMVGAVG